MTHAVGFEKGPHLYTLNEVRVPHVTQVLEHVGLGFDWSFLGDEQERQWYLDRGSAIHEANALMLRSALDPDTVDPLIAKFVANAAGFVKDLEIEPILVEARVACPVLRCAGTLDLFGWSRKLQRFVLIDWKSTTATSSDRLQVEGAYRPLLRSSIRHGILEPIRPELYYKRKVQAHKNEHDVTVKDVASARSAVVTLGGSRATPHWIDNARLEASVFAGSVARYYWDLEQNGSRPK